jgi:hypothetical protein
MDKETQMIVDEIMSALKTPNEEAAKSFSQSGSAISGLTAYDLTAPAKNFFPVLTPLRNDIPRVVGGRGIQANWRGVTGINTGNAGFGISEGNRGVVMAQTTADYLAAFKSCGLDNFVTFEADLAAEGFENLKAKAVMNLMQAAMIEEEKFDLGGNTSLALGTMTAPALVQASTGGSIANGVVVSVVCVALTLEAYQNASVTGGVPLSGTRTLADGTTEPYNRGTSIKSSGVSVTTSGGTATQRVTATVARKNGAVAYAWYWGTVGSEALGAVTTTTTTVITTAVGTGAQLATPNFTADNSRNGFAYDGLLTQIMTAGSGAYVLDQAGGTLTSDNQGGVVEIDTAFQSFWDNYRLSPDEIWVAGQQKKDINNKTMTAATATSARFVSAVGADQNFTGGFAISGYTNKFAMNGSVNVPIKIHPNLPAGTIMFRTKTLPYPLSNVTNVVQKLLRRDYYQIEWPNRTRKYEYGVYMDGVLQNFFPPAFGIITNIAAG